MGRAAGAGSPPTRSVAAGRRPLGGDGCRGQVVHGCGRDRAPDGRCVVRRGRGSGSMGFGSLAQGAGGPRTTARPGPTSGLQPGIRFESSGPRQPGGAVGRGACTAPDQRRQCNSGRTPAAPAGLRRASSGAGLRGPEGLALSTGWNSVVTKPRFSRCSMARVNRLRRWPCGLEEAAPREPARDGGDEGARCRAGHSAHQTRAHSAVRSRQISGNSTTSSMRRR
jgi:hypothetical protein